MNEQRKLIFKKLIDEKYFRYSEIEDDEGIAT